jgi:hypothetical protein
VSKRSSLIAAILSALVADVTEPFNPLSSASAAGPILEASCAENPNSLFGAEGALPIPQTDKPHF